MCMKNYHIYQGYETINMTSYVAVFFYFSVALHFMTGQVMKGINSEKPKRFQRFKLLRLISQSNALHAT